MNNSINDVFENMQKESRDRGLKDDALYTILAARACLEEFVAVCEECTMVCPRPAAGLTKPTAVYYAVLCLNTGVVCLLPCFVHNVAAALLLCARHVCRSTTLAPLL